MDYLEGFPRECVQTACDIAEELLLSAEDYDLETRLVPSAAILRIVQELNAAMRREEPPSRE